MAYLLGTNGNDSLVGTNGPDTLDGQGGNDTLIGNDGSDLLDGGAGADSMNGGLGNDFYIVSAGDVVADAGGFDVIDSSVSWTLAAGFEGLWFHGTATTSGTGNELNNDINGSDGNNWLRGLQGDDTIRGGPGNDTINMSNGSGSSYGNDFIDGDAGVDTLDYGAAARSAVFVDLAAGTASGGGTGGAGSATLQEMENVNGSAFDDIISGDSAANFLYGYDGNDILDGREGNDRLEGAAGNDRYMFTVSPGSSNADTIVGFASSADKIVLDGGAHALLGPNGNFAAGDARFVAGAGLNSGQDASDRVVYNTTTGQVFYDVDGNGSGAAQLIATLQGAPTLVASDIAVQNSIEQEASEGDDYLEGTPGDDTIDGLGGNDTIDGLGGDDTIEGGDGNDLVFGGDGNDVIWGGFGANTLVGGGGDDFLDTSGVGFSNSGERDSLVGGDGNDTLEAGGGVDTMEGGFGDDTYYVYTFLPEGEGEDVLPADPGGIDTVITIDSNWTLGEGFENLRTISDDPPENSSLATFLAGNDLDNLIDGSQMAEGVVEGRGGNDTLFGSGRGYSTYIDGGPGDDLLYGGILGDTLSGGDGNDTLSGSYNVDTMIGGAGADHFILDPGWSRITDFTTGVDTLRLDGNVFAGTGASGRFVSGDQRFHAGADATAAHDATDRLIYNTTTGDLFYDQDGNGAEASVLVATLDGTPGLTATDVEIVHGTGGNNIVGTESDDLRYGTPADDSVFLLGGDDGFHVFGGSQTGAYGNDTVDGGAGFDRVYMAEDDLNRSPIVADLSSGLITGGGPSGSGSVRLISIEGVEGTSFNDLLIGDAGSNWLAGHHGVDTLNGGAGNDTLDGYSGADTYLFTHFGAANADLVDFAIGDEVLLDGNVFTSIGRSGTFAAGDARFFAAGGANTGHDADDRIVYNTTTGDVWYDADGNGAGAAQLVATLWGAPSFDATNIEVINGSAPTGGQTINGTASNDTLVGGAGNDTINGQAGADLIQGLGGNDSLLGSAGWDTLQGGDGNDWLQAGTWSDTVTGGAGSDSFAWAESGSNNRDSVADFVSGTDELLFDMAGFAALGAAGAWAAGDGRFYAAAGASAGHDADDRLVYNTTNGNLYYDADGSGSGSAQLVATLSGAPSVSAADITVFDGSAPPPPPPPPDGSINGTAGDDSLVGTPGNDTINGLGGNDTIQAGEGADSVSGGSGNDSMFAGMDSNLGDGAADTLDGGLGDDVYRNVSSFDGDVIVGDAGGVDTVYAVGSWTLGGGLENLRFDDFFGAFWDGTGNELDNTIVSASAGGNLYGLGGNDLLVLAHLEGFGTAHGGEGNDTLQANRSSELFGDAGDDTLIAWFLGTAMTGGAGNDTFVFENADGGGTGHRIEDFASGQDKVRLDGSGNMSALGASGSFAAGDPRFHTGAAAHDVDDRVIYNPATGELFYDADGSGSGGAMHIATLQAGANVVATDIEVANSTAPVGGQAINGTANNDTLVGGAGNDTINGNAGADLIQGLGGDDSLIGSAGWDTLQGGDGNDVLNGGQWSDTLTGGAGADSFVWAESGNNVRDTVTDFVTGTDELMFDNAAMTALGADASWVAGDGRFWAAAGATSGHDADDRLVYNTTTGNLYYDADGSGAGAAQVVATFQGGVSISAADITVI